ncbi:MAG: hypothetical protein ABJN35_00015 [Erythrobacter sp.]
MPQEVLENFENLRGLIAAKVNELIESSDPINLADNDLLESVGIENDNLPSNRQFNILLPLELLSDASSSIERCYNYKNEYIALYEKLIDILNEIEIQIPIEINRVQQKQAEIEGRISSNSKIRSDNSEYSFLKKSYDQLEELAETLDPSHPDSKGKIENEIGVNFYTAFCRTGRKLKDDERGYLRAHISGLSNKAHRQQTKQVRSSQSSISAQLAKLKVDRDILDIDDDASTNQLSNTQEVLELYKKLITRLKSVYLGDWSISQIRSRMELLREVYKTDYQDALFRLKYARSGLRVVYGDIELKLRPPYQPETLLVDIKAAANLLAAHQSQRYRYELLVSASELTGSAIETMRRGDVVTLDVSENLLFPDGYGSIRNRRIKGLGIVLKGGASVDPVLFRVDPPDQPTSAGPLPIPAFSYSTKPYPETGQHIRYDTGSAENIGLEGRWSITVLRITGQSEVQIKDLCLSFIIEEDLD